MICLSVICSLLFSGAWCDSCLYFGLLVQPGPVHSLRVGQVTSERVEIKWSASRAAALRQLLYSFHISSEYDEKPIQVSSSVGTSDGTIRPNVRLIVGVMVQSRSVTDNF